MKRRRSTRWTPFPLPPRSWLSFPLISCNCRRMNEARGPLFRRRTNNTWYTGCSLLRVSFAYQPPFARLQLPRACTPIAIRRETLISRPINCEILTKWNLPIPKTSNWLISFGIGQINFSKSMLRFFFLEGGGFYLPLILALVMKSLINILIELHRTERSQQNATRKSTRLAEEYNFVQFRGSIIRT